MQKFINKTPAYMHPHAYCYMSNHMIKIERVIPNHLFIWIDSSDQFIVQEQSWHIYLHVVDWFNALQVKLQIMMCYSHCIACYMMKMWHRKKCDGIYWQWSASMIFLSNAQSMHKQYHNFYFVSCAKNKYLI